MLSATITTIIIMADHYYRGTLLISKVQTREHKHTEFKSLAQRPIARKEQIIDLDPSLSVHRF